MSNFFNDVRYIEKVDSTNTYLLTHEFCDRTALYTFEQYAGKGRLDRVWETVRGKNVALSLLFMAPKIAPVWLTATLALGLVKTLRLYGVESAWIKWPNDVHTDQGKLAGILTESQWKGGQLVKVVSGIGVNINATEEDLAVVDKKTTSVCKEHGSEVPLETFTQTLIQSIGEYLELSEEKGIGTLKEEWLALSRVAGRKASLSEVYKGSPPVYGTVEGIDDDGCLYFNDGTTVFKVVTGDINII